MNGALYEVLKHVPEMASLLTVVWFFIKHLAKRDELLKDISGQCHDVQKQAHEVMRDTQVMLGKAVESNSSIVRVIEKLEK